MKSLKLLGITALCSVGAFAEDITYTGGIGFGGTFNLAPFYSAVGIIVVAIGIVASVKLAIGLFKRV